jgi:hypothetical protein
VVPADIRPAQKAIAISTTTTRRGRRGPMAVILPVRDRFNPALPGDVHREIVVPGRPTGPEGGGLPESSSALHVDGRV